MKKLGFGLMRLPLTDEDVRNIDTSKVKDMVDYYMQQGYTYFDTAYVYHKGESENIVKEVLTNRYPRESFILTSKLPIFNLEHEDDMEKIFNNQLEKCGVNYFDYYLLHNVSSKHKDKFTKINSFKFVCDKKKEGKVKHIGISCHDNPDFLEKILINHPEIEVVQLQINYLDWNDNVINARKCYEIACKYDKKIIIMEGLKGGSLVNLPSNALNILHEYDKNRSPVEWSFMFNYSLDNVMVVLSGMNTLNEVKENIAICENFKKLISEDYEMLEKVVKVLCQNILIPCTSCNYCISYCPEKINIPKFFELYNSQNLIDKAHSLGMYYRNLVSNNDNISASNCVKCKKCMDYCPQNIDIPNFLEQIAESFE